MSGEPTIEMRHRGIGGELHYKSSLGEFLIPFEAAEDYRKGWLVFIKNIDSQINDAEPEKVRSTIRQHLQEWAKLNGENLFF